LTSIAGVPNTDKDEMNLRVIKAEATPNPLATKFMLAAPVAPLAGTTMRAYRSPEAAKADPLGAALMAIGGVTSVLIGDSWLTINRAATADAKSIAKSVEAVLAAAR